MKRSIAWNAGLAGLVVALAGAEPPPQAPVEGAEAPGTRLDLVDALLEELDELHRDVDTLRLALAEARLAAAEASRQRDELARFIEDHENLGRDFEQYRTVRDAAEQAARRGRAELSQMEREAERADRRARLEAAAAVRREQDAETRRLEEYGAAGFTPVGLEVFVGQTAFFYESESGLGARVRWDPRMGNYLRVYPYNQVVFSSMTISGSILNASDQVRNIGVAMTFFDENGNQVGSEVIQINNARPDVPYPFTSTITMALNRPFATSSSHVLYADPVDSAAAP